MSTAELTLFVTVAWPLLLAAALVVPRLSRGAARLAPWAALPALVVAVHAVATAAGASSDRLQWLLLGSSFGLDATGRVFLLFSALVWLLAGLITPALEQTAGRTRFWLFFLFSMAGNLGLIAARDVVSFYTLFALMSFASYGLVLAGAGRRAATAARVYITLVVCGELLLITGLIMGAQAAQSLLLADIRAAVPQAAWRDTIIACLLVAFGIKAGLLLVHITLPLIYRAAPLPAAVALAGAMLHAGLLGWLRMLPAGEAALPGWGAVLIGLGLAAAFYAVIVGILQRDARALLAYSSISQMGLMLVGVGAGLAVPAAWPQLLLAVTFFALHHALAKSALFLGLGVVTAGARRWALAALALPSLALAGAPLTSGLLAKTALKQPLGHWQGGGLELAYTLLPWSSLVTALLMIRFLFVVRPIGEQAARVRLWAVFVLGLVAALLLPWLLPPGEPVLAPQQLWSVKTQWGASWPLLLAVALAGLAAGYCRRRGVAAPAVPAGDIVVPLAALGRLAVRGLAAAAATVDAWRRSADQARRGLRLAMRVQGARLLERSEARLRRWRLAMALALVVALLMAALAGA